ncbi:MAG: hypothetical protein HND57_07895 [Planctomycetes bacterium]|nr:hypothetical protein [Planctomycetota bacterium]
MAVRQYWLHLLIVGWCIGMIGCSTTETATGPDPNAPDAGSVNPAARGFDFEGSDAQAIEVADRVMRAMGGRSGWDRTNILAWTFFAGRRHIWNKTTGDYRIDWTASEEDGGASYVLVSNTNRQDKGQVWKDGVALEDRDEISTWLDQGYKWWVNDSYWLIMPYKLKDTGATLTYKGETTHVSEEPTEFGVMPRQTDADILQLTFAGVGVTPDNKYDVYVDRPTGLVYQWSYYANVADEEPAFTSKWRLWERRGYILLSGDRGEGRQLTNIAVYDSLPAEAFAEPEWKEAGL